MCHIDIGGSASVSQARRPSWDLRQDGDKGVTYIQVTETCFEGDDRRYGHGSRLLLLLLLLLSPTLRMPTWRFGIVRQSRER